MVDFFPFLIHAKFFEHENTYLPTKKNLDFFPGLKTTDCM